MPGPVLPPIYIKQGNSQVPIMSFDLTWSWGSKPASAILQLPTDAPVAYGDVTLFAPATAPYTGTAIFYGVCEEIDGTDATAGEVTTVQFKDNRLKLSWDRVFCYFNKRVDWLVNGVWQKYYEHLLPSNFSANLITRTATPYYASQILDFVFTAPTVNWPWSRIYDETQYEGIIYDVDSSTGRTVADLVQEITDRQGLVMTLAQGTGPFAGPYTLIWTPKGLGLVPPTLNSILPTGQAQGAGFPANSDNRRLGQAISGKPDSVTVLGGRNRYQVLGIPMVPDWLQGWQSVGNPASPTYNGWQFPTFELDFVAYVFNNMVDPLSGQRYFDLGDLIGNQLAKARAETMTVGEFCAFLDGTFGSGTSAPYYDTKKFNGRSRLDLPCMVYQRLLVFRAYSLPSNFQIYNTYGQPMGPLNLKIVPDDITEPTYSFVTGEMSYNPATTPGSNGLAIVQGFNFFTPPPQTFQSDNFNISAFQTSQTLWQRVPFQVDDSGFQTQFIIFDEPVTTSQNLLTNINGYACLSAVATLAAPAVMAALTFEAERFSYYAGAEGVNYVDNEANLNSDFVLVYGNTASLVEIPYADGQTGTQKAVALANFLLEQEPVYVAGGYTNNGNNCTQLTGTIDRVTLKLTAQGGLIEEVDFTTERSRNSFEPERDFERRQNLLQMAPGQMEMRDDARNIWSFVAALRHAPKFIKLMIQAFTDRYGPNAGQPVAATIIANDTGEGAILNMGTPVFASAPNGSTGRQAVLPENADPDASPVFMGCTVRHQENARGSNGVVLQNTGTGVVRVLGPAKIGDSLVMEPLNDYLVSQNNSPAPADINPDDDPNYTNQSPAVATLLQTVAAPANPDSPQESDVYLALVQFSPPAGGGIFQAQIVTEYDDYLLCQLVTSTSSTTVDVDDDGNYVVYGPDDEPIPTGATIRVAKPFLLRRQSYDGLTLPDPDNALAEYVGPGFRTMTYTPSGESEITTNQAIYPYYVPGAIIDVSEPVGGTGVMSNPAEEGGHGDSVPVTYQDEDNDDRDWATEWPAPNANGVCGFALVKTSQWYLNSIGS